LRPERTKVNFRKLLQEQRCLRCMDPILGKTAIVNLPSNLQSPFSFVKDSSHVQLFFFKLSFHTIIFLALNFTVNLLMLGCYPHPHANIYSVFVKLLLFKFCDINKVFNLKVHTISTYICQSQAICNYSVLEKVRGLVTH
jgi:hypothetical protein